MGFLCGFHDGDDGDHHHHPNMHMVHDGYCYYYSSRYLEERRGEERIRDGEEERGDDERG